MICRELSLIAVKAADVGPGEDSKLPKSPFIERALLSEQIKITIQNKGKNK